MDSRKLGQLTLKSCRLFLCSLSNSWYFESSIKIASLMYKYHHQNSCYINQSYKPSLQKNDRSLWNIFTLNNPWDWLNDSVSLLLLINLSIGLLLSLLKEIMTFFNLSKYLLSSHTNEVIMNFKLARFQNNLLHLFFLSCRRKQHF